jgi:hypothetical protein
MATAVKAATILLGLDMTSPYGFVGAILDVTRSEPCSEIGEGVTDWVIRPPPDPMEILVRGFCTGICRRYSWNSVDTASERA